MPPKLERVFRVGPFDSNARGELSLPGLVRRLQEIADEHVALGRASMQHLYDSGRTWVILELTLEMERMPEIGTEFQVRTWIPRTSRPVRASRCSEYALLDGTPMGRGVSLWLMLDKSTGRPVKMPAELTQSATGDPVEWAEKPELRIPMGAEWRVEAQVSWHDLDINRHANNVRYIEWLMAPMPGAYLEGRRMRWFDVSFRKEARAGDKLELVAQRVSENRVEHAVLGGEGEAYAVAVSEWLKESSAQDRKRLD